MNGLRECPFCGGTELLVFLTCFGHQIECRGCGLVARFEDREKSVPVGWTARYCSEIETKVRWNIRFEYDVYSYERGYADGFDDGEKSIVQQVSEIVENTDINEHDRIDNLRGIINGFWKERKS